MIDLRSQLRQRLLAYYFTNPSARLHLRGLARVLEVDPANLLNELKRLERFGLFLSEREGRQRYFRLNKKFGLYREIAGIVASTVGVVPMLREALQHIEGIEEAYLYGSFARGGQDTASDVDVLIVGRPAAQKLERAIRTLERRLGREINYTVMSKAELRTRRGRGDAFLADIWRHKRIALVEER
jgi:predicted nucleotidyltransferase